MQVLRARNVEHALQLGLGFLQAQGVRRGSRNGPVLVSEEPVTTVYERPRERVLFWPERDANPFFHLYESLWMLNGQRDAATLARYVKRMATFSDDGQTLNAAYGYRCRRHFGRDQLQPIVQALRTNPDDRRCILQIWDQKYDLARPTKDAACNTTVHFQRGYEGQLDMTVFCRSNDIIWGAYGANAVHFSYLQEFVASFVGCPVGRYWQVSDNFHAYEDVFRGLVPGGALVAGREPWNQWYDAIPRDGVAPLVSTSWELWHDDLTRFMEDELLGLQREDYADSFFGETALPMLRAHHDHRRGFVRQALENAGRVADRAWSLAATMWLERRYDRRRAADDGGELNRKEV
ncbi:MAG: thymidylate synthase [Pseudonocardiaceae bacterium]